MVTTLLTKATVEMICRAVYFVLDRFIESGGDVNGFDSNTFGVTVNMRSVDVIADRGYALYHKLMHLYDNMSSRCIVRLTPTELKSTSFIGADELEMMIAALFFCRARLRESHGEVNAFGTDSTKTRQELTDLCEDVTSAYKTLKDAHYANQFKSFIIQ